MIVQFTRTVHKLAYRTGTGSLVRLHDKSNHGPWLSIALFLDDLSKAASASGCKRSAAAAEAADMSAGPVGNHGENKFSTACTAQEVRP